MRADRLLSLMLLLQARGRMTAQELAEKLEVSERTVYRDLSALGMAGIPVTAERGPGGGCGLMEGYRTNLTGLTAAEVHTLFMSGAASPLKDLGLAPAMEAALLKLLAALPKQRRGEAERARQRLHVDTAGWGRPGDAVPHLRALQEAIWQDHRVRMVYRPEGRNEGERVVEPLGLVFKANIWYLVARSIGELRVFRVSRVADVRPLEETFERPADFDLAAYWAESCALFEASWNRYAATLRVSPELAPYLSFHFSDGTYTPIEQADPPGADGWLTLTFTFDSFEAARTRILGLGTLVEVVEPAELRASVIEIASSISSFYAAREKPSGELTPLGHAAPA